MNKKGISGGVIAIIAIAVILVWSQTTILQDLLGMGEEPIPTPTGQCPSSGLTSVTINTQEALASSATDSVHDYYVFDKDGVLVSNGNSGSDGSSTFDVQCGAGKKYDAIVLNESANLGFYAEMFEIDAFESTFSTNLQTYEYGTMDISAISSDADPSGGSNISSGLGKVCGFTITFTVNESASAFNKPLILCQANTTGIIDITMPALTEADSKRPTRMSALPSYDWWVFELDKKILSTDAAQKASGKIQFSSSNTPDGSKYMNCSIVDQATYKKADYKTLGLNQGFVVAAEDDSNANVGAPDSKGLGLGLSTVTGYC